MAEKNLASGQSRTWTLDCWIASLKSNALATQPCCFQTNWSLFVLIHVNDFNYRDLIFLKMFSDKEVHHEKILLWFLFSFEDLNPHQHLGLSISEVYPLMCKLVRYWQLTCTWVMGLFLLICLMNCWLQCFNCVLLVFNRQRCPLTVCKAMSGWNFDEQHGHWTAEMVINDPKMGWNYEKPLCCMLSFFFCFLVRHTKNNNNSQEQNLT